MDNKSSSIASASLGRVAAQYDLVGPTAQDDIRRAINRYGKEAVVEAIKAITRPRRGRPKVNDWPELRYIVEVDAREWLLGGDPISTRSNYSIAKEYADKNPGQSAISTHQRVERKLSKKPYDRLWHMLVTAESLSRDEYSWRQHLRALEELGRINTHSVWDSLLQQAVDYVSDYEARHGGQPADDLTMQQVQEEGIRALMALGQVAKRGLPDGR